MWKKKSVWQIFAMNIFFLHWDVELCASMHCDKHVVKMILEYCQLLSTAWHVIDPDHQFFSPRYKKTHINHPCSIWVRQHPANYVWLCELCANLLKEYTHRYDKVHKSQPVLQELQANIPPIQGYQPPFDSVNFQTLPQAMPRKFKHSNAFEAYRMYYVCEKKHILAWKRRPVPDFVNYLHPESEVHDVLIDIISIIERQVSVPCKKRKL